MIFNIWFNYKGISIKSTGDTSITGKLVVGKDDVMYNTTIETYIQIHNSYQGFTGYVRIYQWRDYVLIFNIVTNRSTAIMFVRLK